MCIVIHSSIITLLYRNFQVKIYIEKVYKRLCMTMSLSDEKDEFMAKEKMIETKLCKAVKAVGGLCLKFVSPSYAGVPD